MKKIKNIIKYIFNIIVITIVLYATLIVLFDGSKLFPIRLTRVVSGSMEPAIATGAICITSNQVEDITVGDIVIFENEALYGERSIIHRIVDMTEDSILTKGDHNSYVDSYIPKANVSAKVVKIFNGASFLYSPTISKLTENNWFRISIKCLYTISILTITALSFDLDVIYNKKIT